MLERILEYLKNYFVDSREIFTSVVVDGIVGTFSETYMTGQYVSIDNTRVNNGVYKILSATTTKVTLDASLTPEIVTGVVWGLIIPKAVQDLAIEITAYDASSTKGVASESQGKRSVTYASEGTSDWQSVYKSHLAPYRQMFSDKQSWIRRWGYVAK